MSQIIRQIHLGQGSGDRHTIIGDIVTCWLALPEETKNDYTNTEPRISPIVHFGWECVERVEQSDQPALNKPFPPDPTEEQ